MIKLVLTPLFMLTFSPVIPTTLIPLPCSTSLTTSLFVTWSPWPLFPHLSGLFIQATLTKPPCHLALHLHVSSHGINQPLLATLITMVTHLSMVTLTWDTFEGLTGRTTTNKNRERMDEAQFHWVQVLPQDDNPLIWLIEPRRHIPNHVPAWGKLLRRLTEVLPHCFT